MVKGWSRSNEMSGQRLLSHSGLLFELLGDRLCRKHIIFADIMVTMFRVWIPTKRQIFWIQNSQIVVHCHWIQYLVSHDERSAITNNARHDQKDLYLAILDFRNTPTQWLMNRRTNTLLPTKQSLLQPNTVSQYHVDNEMLQQKQQFYYNQGTKAVPVSGLFSLAKSLSNSKSSFNFCWSKFSWVCLMWRRFLWKVL
jgi:hypothetical protein